MKQPSHEWIRGRCGFRFARRAAVLGFFCLIAINALTGCKTSSPSPSQSATGKSSATAKPARNHVSNDRATTKDNKIPKPEAGQTNTPAKLAAIPVPPPSQTLIATNDCVATKIEKQPTIPESQSTTPAVTPLIVGNPTLPDSKPDSPGRSSLTIPDTDINPVPPAGARPTFDALPNTAILPDKIPSAVNLSRLASPAADLPVPHQSVVIRLPTLDEQAPTRTAPPTLNVFNHPAMPDVTFGSQDNPHALRIFSDADPVPIQNIRSNQFNTLPLPVPSSVSWPAKVQPDVSGPDLSNWLASPTPTPQTAPATTREARDTLHQKFYNLILGN